MINSEYKILLVEDDPIDRMAFKRFVQNENLQYEYRIVESITEAKRLISDFKFEAIITDYLLGDGTGFDILNLVKDIPIIFVTGAGNEQIAVRAIKTGAYDYLIKDIDRNYLRFLPVTLDNAIKHKKAEEELKLAEQKIDKLSWIASKTDNAIIIANPGGRIEWVNEGFTRLSHYTLEEVKGTYGEILRKGESTGLTPGNIQYETLQKDKTSVTYEAQNYTKEGTPYWIVSTLTPALNQNGEIERIIVIDSDITVRKQMEKELVIAKYVAEDSFQKVNETLRKLMSMQKQLEETVRMKEKFIADMSHEIQTSMNSIINLADTLLKTNLNEDQVAYIDVIKKSGVKLLLEIKDIIDLSKRDAHKMIPEK
ncbi:MAG: response regulator [Bacteroidetes bacterium]|nr:response regulator [Bacteroidota bacterium]